MSIPFAFCHLTAGDDSAPGERAQAAAACAGSGGQQGENLRMHGLIYPALLRESRSIFRCIALYSL
ncbi:hypothetical protein V2A60_003410 [Cordyceps javanica]